MQPFRLYPDPPKENWWLTKHPCDSFTYSGLGWGEHCPQADCTTPDPREGPWAQQAPGAAAALLPHWGV